MTTAREAILERVRAARGVVHEERAAAYARIGRSYGEEATMPRESALALFVERLEEYDARVWQVRGDAIGETVRRVLADRGARRMVVPEGLPVAWLEGAEFVENAGLTARELDGLDGVLTGATVAVAETGSVMLQHGAREGRRALTLVPDYHLCVVRASELVETLVEGLRRLEGTPGLPTTIFSGPSATADIEMTRIKGVHGPRFLDVVLVEDM